MTKTKYWLPIVAISVVLIASSIAVNPIALATVAGVDEPLLFRWDPADTSSDPSNLIAINASFERAGLASESTSDVQGQVEGLLKGDSENNSETTVTTMTGPSTTITTTVKAKSQDANDLEGEILIDGERFATKLTLLASKTTTLEVTEVFSSPTLDQTSIQEKLTIPVTIVMCTDTAKCFKGFGVLRSESNITEVGGSTISFSTDTLEAELIGDAGLFELKLTKLQRTVT